MFKFQTSTSRNAQLYQKKKAADYSGSKILTPEEREIAANIYNKKAVEYNRFIPLKATAWIRTVTDWANAY